MGFLRTKLPSRPNKENASLISKFVSAYLPIVYEFRRVDLYSGSVVSAGGFIRLTELTISSQSKFEIGESVYFYSGSSPLIYPGASATITSIVAISGGFAITLDALFISFADMYVNSVLADYFLTITIKGFNWTTNLFETVGNVVLNTAVNGFARLELQTYISKYLNLLDQVGYAHSGNRLDKTNSTKFYIESFETYKGIPGTLIVDSNIIFATNCVKQVGSKYGQNLADFVPFNNSGLTIKAKFISDFERPTMFEGYPFDISFLYPEELALIDATVNEERFNLNNALIGSKDRNLDKTQTGGENRLLPILVTEVPGYLASVDSFDIWIQLGSVAVEEWVEPGYAETVGIEDYAESVPELPPPVITPFRVTELMRIDYVRPCNKNPVYLRWKGLSGGWSYWLFDENNETETISKELGRFGNNLVDLEYAIGRESVIKRTGVPALRIVSTLPGIKFEGLKKIALSPEIQMYSPESPSLWQSVTIRKSLFKKEHRHTNSEVSLELDLPEYFTIEQ